MPVRIGVPRERAKGERRVAITPEIAAKLAGLGAEVLIERGAGEGAFHADADYTSATVVPGPAELYAAADLVLSVRRPESEDSSAMRPGTVLVGHLRPYQGGPSLEGMLRSPIRRARTGEAGSRAGIPETGPAATEAIIRSLEETQRHGIRPPSADAGREAWS